MPAFLDKLDKTITAAQTIVAGTSPLDLSKLDRIYDLQRLLGPIIAYKILLEISINSADAKERRMAASKLLDAATGEDPERIADRLRASVFESLTLQELEAIVQTGITDPEEAIKLLKGGEEE